MSVRAFLGRLGGAGPSQCCAERVAFVWPLAPPHAFRLDTPPLNFAARRGLYAFDAGTPVTAGSWAAAREGATCALAAAQAVLAGAQREGLTRPPGHHARPRYMSVLSEKARKRAL